MNFATGFDATRPQRGLYLGIPNEVYHAAPGASASGLKQLMRSPAHYRAYLAQEFKETPAKRLGRIIHAAVLEPDSWATGHALEPSGINKKTKSGKEEFAAFIVENKGKEVVTESDMETINRVQDAVYRHPAAKALLSHAGHAEVSAWAEDQQSGELVKSRPDYMRTDNIVVDLKTCEDASPAAFAKACANYGYDLQEAHYRNVLREVVGTEPDGFIFLAVEKMPPYGVATYTLPRESVYAAKIAAEDMLLQLADCKISGRWNAYSERIEELAMPRWHKINKEAA